MRSSHFREVVVCFSIFAQLAVAQQYVCHYPDGTPWEGLHKASYNAYIPGDHINGPTVCYYYIGGDSYPFTKIYRADGSPVQDLYPVSPARVFHFLFFQYNQQQGVVHDASQTRNYGAFSPANGSTLSGADEDGIQYDCYLWNDAGYADLSDFHEDLSFPYATQGQAHLYGTASNPLESSVARIQWDVRHVVDYSNLDYVTAYANVTHTCFPAHVLQVNNKIIYQYTPPRNDIDYVFGCLVLQTGKIQGFVTPTQQVPCQ